MKKIEENLLKQIIIVTEINKEIRKRVVRGSIVTIVLGGAALGIFLIFNNSIILSILGMIAVSGLISSYNHWRMGVFLQEIKEFLENQDINLDKIM